MSTTHPNYEQPELAYGPFAVPDAMPSDPHALVPAPREALGEDQEAARLKAMLEEHELVQGRAEVLPVGEAGYVVRLADTPAVPGNDWVLFDLDDTLVAASEAKQTRQERFRSYAEENGLALNPEETDRLLTISDDFSRWPVHGRETYHLDAHLATLDWLTEQLGHLHHSEREAALQALVARLEAIKAGHSEPQEGLSPPFSIVRGQFRTATGYRPSPAMEAVFAPTYAPAALEPVEALRRLSGTYGSGQQINSVVFTFGQPDFQLSKTLEMLRQQAAAGHPIKLTHIWLTRVVKGEFTQKIAELAESGRYGLQDELFDSDPHAMLLVDDDPEQLDSFHASNDLLSRLRGPSFIALRLIQRGTKHAETMWLQAEDGRRQMHDRRFADGQQEGTADAIFETLAAEARSLMNGRAILDPVLNGRLRLRRRYYEARLRTLRRIRQGELNFPLASA